MSLRNFNLLSCQISKRYLTFVLGANVIFIMIYNKQTDLLLWKEALPLASNAVCYISNLEKVVQNKAKQSACDDETNRNMRDQTGPSQYAFSQ